ncbi:hypothetical protein BGZ65_008346, partial [Modicella reniformis]
ATPIRALTNVTLPKANIRSVFKASFDMDKVENICKSHRLSFADMDALNRSLEVESSK